MMRINSFGRTSGNEQKVAEKESSSASMILRDGNNFEVSAKDYKESSLGQRNINHRCGYFTILSPDANGNWRAVAVALQCLDVRKCAESESQSFTDGKFSERKRQHHFQSNAVNSKLSRGNALPGKSTCQSSSNNDGFSVAGLSDIHTGTSKMGKPREKNKRKKAKKKGKRDQKFSLDAGSIDTHVHGSSTDGNISSKNTDSTGSVSCETTSAVLSPDSSSNTSEDNRGGSDEVDVIETNSSGLPPPFNSTCGAHTAASILSTLETVQDSHYESLGCVKDTGFSVLPEAIDSLVLDSISVCSNADGDISSSSSVNMKHKQSKKVPSNSIAPKISSLSKFPCHSVKKNISWQRVSGNDTAECSSEPGKEELFAPRCVNSSKLTSFVKKNQKVSQFNILSTGEDENQSKVRRPGKLKRRTSAGSKQECNFNLRKLSYASKSTSNLCVNIGKDLNDAVDISQHLSRENGLVSIPKPMLEVDLTRIEAETIDSDTFGHVQQLECRSSKVEPLEEFCFTSSHSLTDRTVKQDCKMIPSHLEYSSQTGTEGLGRGKYASPIEHDKHNQVSGPNMNKRTPVGNKDSELALSDHSRSSQCVDNEAVESSKLENTAMDMPSSAFDCSVNSSTKCFKQGFRAEDAQHSDTVPICNDSVESAVDNVSNMIKKAVNDAYRVQLASEAVEKAIGCPVAELERFLRSASSVISLPNNIPQCRICSPGEVSVAPLCRSKIPNLTLGNLWQWYEKLGTFGLEVKAEDCENSKRLGVDRFMFRAYFVPFLSAVQLFSPRRRFSSGTSRKFPDSGASVPCKLAKNSSSNNSVSIFSVLVPKPKIMGNAIKQCDDSTSSDELELVYEYFEAERPQQRRPLFEMIKHLVSGNEPFPGRAFGDPSKLDSVAINDLHPQSWYSVAWYPIYRIPDDKFHSAFLTYHSLGHLTHQRASMNSFPGNTCLVSPVVGLQSYNTQGECWLQPKNLTPSQLKEIPNANHCEILKERLRTLEHTASVMARAEVVKGNATSVNRQPDYEFFLSRRW